MKKVKKLVFSFMAAIVLLCCASVVCPNMFGTETVEAATIKISKTKMSLKAGQKYRLKITGTNQRVKWKSSKPKVASVGSKGLVTAKKLGVTRIEATVGGRKYTCIVTVQSQMNTTNDLETNALYMAAYGIHAAYEAAKFPSTLHINKIYYRRNEESDSMLIRCYAQNSFGGYGDIYVVSVARKNRLLKDDIYEKRANIYMFTNVFGANPSAGNAGKVYDNKKAVDAYNLYLGDKYGKKDIPYD